MTVVSSALADEHHGGVRVRYKSRDYKFDGRLRCEKSRAKPLADEAGPFLFGTRNRCPPFLSKMRSKPSLPLLHNVALEISYDADSRVLGCLHNLLRKEVL